MSIDPSLKLKGALKRHRNVLKRAERIEKLKDEERWTPDDPVLSLPKVEHRKVKAGKKEAEEAEEKLLQPEETPTPKAGSES